jgi:hypothetical protein
LQIMTEIQIRPAPGVSIRTSPARKKPTRSIRRTAMRGVIGAMAMTGMRQVSTSLGMVKQTPPESVAAHATSGRSRYGMARRAPEEAVRRRTAGIELLHWLYGAGGGALYGVLPHRLRRTTWAGPIYGVILWGLFETTVAPVIGVTQRESHGPAEKLALLADHILYGLVLGTASHPHQD